MSKNVQLSCLKVSLAALFHDIGKFAQGGMYLPPDYERNNADLYQPFNVTQKRHTHVHALYTAAFIEQKAKWLPEELTAPEWGKGEREDSFINLAAKHHKPDTALQWIIAQADRLSSGLDRAEFEEGQEIGIREYRQTRLLPIFERLLREDKEFTEVQDFLWRYPLSPLSATSIFPVKKEEILRERAEEEYKRLFEKFCNDLEKLCHRKHVALWAQHFDSLLRVYTSYIPAARVGKVVHDVSLYDHLRTTAALAGALYLYHRETNTLEPKAIQDDSQPKFLLVSGDFYGIQNFIFRGGGEERHHRAKLLRGRSFLVSLLVELAAEMICEELGLFFLSIFFCAAGKFHLLAPNTEATRQRLKETQEKINSWLFEQFFGECALGLASTEARPEEFVTGGFADLWQCHLERLEEAKFKRLDLKKFGGVREGFLDEFRNDLPSPLCPLCGERPSSKEVLGDDYISRKGEEEKACSCKLCQDQAFLGTHLVRGERLAILSGGEGKLKEPLFGRYQVKFGKGYFEKHADKGLLVKLLELNVAEDGSIPVEVTFAPINGYVPKYTAEDNENDCLLTGEKSDRKKEELIEAINEDIPKTFYHLAQNALRLEIENGRKHCCGLPALAVLKADVDNLGAIFGCGLPAELFTLSRLFTMSRQLNNFFTVYLPYALRNEKNGVFRDIYTVFAGGDDLFLIGPWNRVRDLASFLRAKFAQYVCENPHLHFSAGITLHKPHTPVDLLAQESELALEEAKKGAKNQVNMFGETVTWEEFAELFQVEERLKAWHEKGWLSRRTLYRLNELCELAREEERLLALGSIPWHKLQCVKWPAYLRYFLVRAIRRELGKEWEVLYQEMVNEIYTWLKKFRGRFVLALWPLLYNTRKQSL